MYTSTRNAQLQLNSKEALTQGFATDGGLFVLPTLPKVDLAKMLATNYQGQAKIVLSALLPDFEAEVIDQVVTQAYGQQWDDDRITPLQKLNDQYVLELFHGPTSAFKDIGLQVLPRLLHNAIDAQTKVLILAATSGDTGKAALEGFKDVPQTGIATFYPDGGVSPIQEKQMRTTGGDNTHVAAIKGNFDDAQTAVKQMLNNAELAAKLGSVKLSVANSINIGRLAPQVVYYFNAYQQLVQAGAIEAGDKINFTVPTGNFGDVLAGYYAKLMGLPVDKLIVATNANSEVSDFLKTGIYDRNREFIKTVSPSMDIQISSNLERLLFYKSGGDSALVAKLMQDLAETGRYQVTAALLEAIQQDFVAGSASDDDVQDAIALVDAKADYVMDPHTANGYVVQHQLNVPGVTVLLSTASPFKFPQVVAEAVLQERFESGFEAMAALQDQRHLTIPAPLAKLQQLPDRFDTVLNPEAMPEWVAQLAKEM
jgi:threonine synthase